MRKLTLSLLCLLALAGCTTTKPALVHKKELVLLEIDPRYLRDCHVVAPPDEELYLTSSMDQREDMLTRTILDQHQSSRECSNDKKAIRDLLEKYRKQVEDFNRKEESK